MTQYFCKKFKMDGFDWLVLIQRDAGKAGNYESKHYQMDLLLNIKMKNIKKRCAI
ncbi:hypothetical protein STZ1_40340 [Bacillus subtilis]